MARSFPWPDLMGADDAALARLAPPPTDPILRRAPLSRRRGNPLPRVPAGASVRRRGPGDESSSLVYCPSPAPWVVGWRRDAGVECPRAPCCCARPASVLGRLLACGFLRGSRVPSGRVASPWARRSLSGLRGWDGEPCGSAARPLVSLANQSVQPGPRRVNIARRVAVADNLQDA